MKKILFPTDFSEVANNAFVYALKLADAIGAEIITLHVYELPQLDYMNVPVYLLDIYEVTELSNFENYKHHIPVLRSLAEEFNLEHIKISNVLENGNLIDNIHKIATDDHIDYIVMGTKGVESFAATFLGSVTEKVMHHSKTTVLAIPKECSFEPIKSILFITKYKSSDQLQLQKVIELAYIFHSHIDCLYVAAFDKLDERLITDWQQAVNYEDIAFHNIPSEDVEGGILNFIDSNNIDMLAMALHQKGFFEGLFHISLSKKLAFHVTIPILAMHE